jgi:hypothetical protein
MKGDFTRFTFAKDRRYSDVLEQQGRLELDADANEQVAIRDHLGRTTNIDVIGRTGAPENDAGFAITADGVGIGIGAGRMYVDGILCELDEAATYTVQPHLPSPEPLDPADGRTDLVYLDVWQRHVTAVEDPSLLDPALDGLDTTTRIQTIWQVRVRPDIGTATCAEALAALPHSGARLTTGAVATPEPDTPCDIVVAGGYRGVENRLYRVEIHDGGALGTATWKWSRDNGSVAFAIEEFLTAPADRIRLRAPGRDRYLALRQDDWVEIHDDASELGLGPGFTAQVTSVDESTRTVTLDRDIPAGRFEAARNPRVRRWDQTEDIDGDGLLDTGAGAHDLEDGVQVTFGGADYRTGDWWAFAARTAGGTVEGLTDSPAAGVVHHYAALARVQWSAIDEETFGLAVLEDCRDTFPSLTNICADDVCFDNGNCALPGAETVQDAIDQLCAGRDLRWHNRHLHGWGIVCGLQVVCGPDNANRGRRNVTVRSGYALDCDGSDLILRDDVTVDLLDRIQALDRLDPNNPILRDGDGEVCLVIGRNGGDIGIEIERYQPPTGNVFEQALSGTLLKDFADGCVKAVLDFLREQTRDDDDRLVGPGRRRMTTLLNLIIQVADSANGRHVWLSAEEDRILREFYPKLRELLRSRTFCAMFENARPLPDYPFREVAQPTVFGKGGHTRLRLRDGSPFAWTAGSGNVIHMYDLERGEMIAEVEFPGGTGVTVRDIAISRNGRQLHAIASLGNDTLFATADISGQTHTFRPFTVMRDVELTTLAFAGAEDRTILAIGRGRGLYEFSPTSPPASPQPRHAFNAVGHLVVNEENGLMFATARSEGAPDVYDRIVRMSIAGGPPPLTHPLSDVQGVNRTGTDDIAVAPAGQRRWKLYAVASAATQGAKDILVYDVSPSATAPPTPRGTIPVDSATMRLAALGTTGLIVTRRETNDLILIDTGADRVVPERTRDGADFRHPLQIAPGAVAASAQGNAAYVLNTVSNTITVIPASVLSPERAIDRDALAAYRDGMIAAYADLLAGLLQYLKDCLCDRLLVDCPTCDEDDRVHLGCVSIRGGAVYRVCNFSKRKYVRSFPTVEYWLSLVPVIPLLGVLIERFCCAVLPDLFGRFEPGRAGGRTNLGAMRLGSLTTMLGRFDTKSLFNTLGSRADLAGRFAGDWLRAPVDDVPEKGRIPRDEVFGQQTPQVREKLEQLGATVAGVERYDPGTALLDVARPGALPGKVAPGERVILYEDREGVVRHWTVVKGAVADQPTIDIQDDLRRIDDTVRGLHETRELLTAARTEINTLRATLSRVETESNAAMGTRDRQIESLQTELARVERDSAAALESRDRNLRELQESSRKLESELGTIERLRADVELLKRRG